LKRSSYLAGVLLAVVLCGLAVADKPPVVEISEAEAAKGRALITGFVDSTKAWQAAFDQKVTDPSGRIVDRANGDFSLLRPGRFRWEYRSPWVQTIVADGERIWMYDADLEQVTVRPMDGMLSSTPAALLAGDTAALEAFVVTAVGEDGDETWVQLEPVDAGGDFDRIRVGFRNGKLIGLQLTDKLAQTTTIFFANATAAPELTAADFEFVVPDGVDVIDESSF